MLRNTCGAILLLGVVVSVCPAQNAIFQGLGDFAGGEFRSEARAVSADGRFVVGLSVNDSASEAFRWSAESGMTRLGLPLGALASTAEGVSGDGSVVVGYAGGSGSTRPFRWTTATGTQVLEPGAENAYALDVSADGQTIVGGYGASTVLGAGQEAFRWTEAGQYQFLFPDDGSTPSSAFAVSGDGSVVVGQSSRVFQAFRWTNEDGLTPLGDLPGGDAVSFAHGISDDGRIIVGEGSSASGPEPFRWTAETGMIGLGRLPGGDFFSTALATSNDGSVIVGTSVLNGRTTAFIWDQARGMRSLQSVLQTDYGLNLAGWQLNIASDVSANGFTIAGTGINPAGDRGLGCRGSRAVGHGTHVGRDGRCGRRWKTDLVSWWLAWIMELLWPLKPLVTPAAAPLRSAAGDCILPIAHCGRWSRF